MLDSSAGVSHASIPSMHGSFAFIIEESLNYDKGQEFVVWSSGFRVQGLGSRV